MQKTGKIIVCPICGKKKYFRGAYLKEGRRCCSKKCGDKLSGLIRTGKTTKLKGQKFTNDHRIKIARALKKYWSITDRRKNNEPNWHLRDAKYNEWRAKVFLRDNFTCQICFIRGVPMNSHHLWSRKLYPELRFEISNGVTLCENCHRLVHKITGKKDGLLFVFTA